MPRITAYIANGYTGIYIGIGQRISLAGFKDSSKILQHKKIESISVGDLLSLVKKYSHSGPVQLFDLDVVVKKFNPRGELAVYLNGRADHLLRSAEVRYVQMPQDVADYVNAFITLQRLST